MPSRRRKRGPQPDQTQPGKRRHEDECSDHKAARSLPIRASGMLIPLRRSRSGGSAPDAGRRGTRIAA
jgi:hypothetical protein